MKEFVPSGFFVLRTPLLPVQDFLKLSEGLNFSRALRDGGDLASAASADRKQIRARLRILADRAEVKEALWLASPEFYEALSLWWKDPESEKGQRLEHSLYRYVARMMGRPTPFGLFAGCTVGHLGAHTRLEFGGRNTYYRRSRLDMEYLCNLAEKISSDRALQSQLLFRPNTSLYFAAGQYHHTQGYLDHGLRAYRLIATDPSPYLAATLERASSGATASQLASALVRDDQEISMEEAGEYIRKLIESQVLVSDLTPPITGPEPIEDMLTQLDAVRDSSLKTSLCSISEHLRRLDEGRIGNGLQGYQEIVKTIMSLPAEFKVDHLVQVDMMKPAAHVSLDQRLIRSVLRAVEALHSMSPAFKDDSLEQFKKDFRERYQDQEVPLLLALDEEVGIGFERREGAHAVPEPLIEDLDLAAVGSSTGSTATEAEFILLRKVEELAQKKKTTLELDPALLKSLQTRDPLPLPDAFAVMGSVIGTSDGSGKFSFYLHNATGPSGALLLGRFCHADCELATCVQEHLRAEEAVCAGDNVLFAEVAHLPEGRIGNVLYRPLLRRYEIPFLANSRGPADRQIAVADLMVLVENDRIILRSRRLGCEVLPRLTSAHGYAYSRNLKLYKFLCLLQTQGVSASLAWDWGFLEQALFLPRVVLDDVILAPARWHVTKAMIETFANQRGREEIQKWRERVGAPRFVLLAEADNQLLIDFENILSVETLVDYIRKRESARLVEMLPPPDKLSAFGPEGSFTSEVVIPFVRKKHSTAEVAVPSTKRDALQDAARISTIESRNIGRTFLPGSEWLFAKIYASPSQLDHLLLEHVAPLVRQVTHCGDADGWFFIRYTDPEWHLRLRFHGHRQKLSAQVLPLMWERLEQEREQGKAWRVQLDTYEREIERYGGIAGTHIAERLFQLDSELVLELLAAIAGDLGGKIRWQLAFCSADTLMSGLGLELNARRQLVNGLGQVREKDFAVDERYKKQLSAKYRDERPFLETFLEPSMSEFPPAAQAALQSFAGQAQTIRIDLERLQQSGELTRTIPELAGSYLHMHLNRIFRSAANDQEMVLYDFLARTYESKLARQKKLVKHV